MDVIGDPNGDGYLGANPDASDNGNGGATADPIAEQPDNDTENGGSTPPVEGENGSEEPGAPVVNPITNDGEEDDEEDPIVGETDDDDGEDPTGETGDDEVQPPQPRYSPRPRGLGNGAEATYYNEKDFTQEVFVRTDGTIDWDWGKESPDPVMDKNNFSVVWEAELEIPETGGYRFIADADDWIYVYLDDELILEKTNNNKTPAISQLVDFEAGERPQLRVEYVENGGDAWAKLEWESDSFGRQVIPQERLYSGEALLYNQPLIGFIDTGFAANNPDLDYGRITLGYDYVDGDANPLLDPGEGNEHGTFVAGLVGATQNNDMGIYGMTNDAPLWFGRAVGSGQWAQSLTEFVDYFQESGAINGVVNLSFDLTQVDAEGNVSTRYQLTAEEQEALNYAASVPGLLMVAGAGNNSEAISALGQSSQVLTSLITVGAVNEDRNNRADYSSTGAGLDVLAWGGTAEDPLYSLAGEGLATMSGTSVAAAKVSGLAAFIWSINPDLSSAQVKDIIVNTATDLNQAGWDSETGYGLINVFAAQKLARGTEPLPFVPELLSTEDLWTDSSFFTPGERAQLDDATPTDNSPMNTSAELNSQVPELYTLDNGVILISSSEDKTFNLGYDESMNTTSTKWVNLSKYSTDDGVRFSTDETEENDFYRKYFKATSYQKISIDFKELGSHVKFISMPNRMLLDGGYRFTFQGTDGNLAFYQNSEQDSILEEQDVQYGTKDLADILAENDGEGFKKDKHIWSTGISQSLPKDISLPYTTETGLTLEPSRLSFQRDGNLTAYLSITDNSENYKELPIWATDTSSYGASKFEAKSYSNGSGIGGLEPTSVTITNQDATKIKNILEIPGEADWRPGLDIQLNFDDRYTPFTDQQKAIIEQAAVNWERIITGDMIPNWLNIKEPDDTPRGVLHINLVQEERHFTLVSNNYSGQLNGRLPDGLTGRINTGGQTGARIYTSDAYPDIKSLEDEFLNRTDQNGNPIDDVYINFRPTVGAKGTTYQLTLAMHELGHALGLPDYPIGTRPSDALDESLMNPTETQYWDGINNDLYNKIEELGYRVNRTASVQWTWP
ncbi:MAG: hypothetical protein RLZZ435_2250 [Cyanobacteriota bacterium]